MRIEEIHLPCPQLPGGRQDKNVIDCCYPASNNPSTVYPPPVLSCFLNMGEDSQQTAASSNFCSHLHWQVIIIWLFWDTRQSLFLKCGSKCLSPYLLNFNTYINLAFSFSLASGHNTLATILD